MNVVFGGCESCNVFGAMCDGAMEHFSTLKVFLITLKHVLRPFGIEMPFDRPRAFEKFVIVIVSIIGDLFMKYPFKNLTVVNNFFPDFLRILTLDGLR